MNSLELCPFITVTISEDYSRKTRDSRDKLRKFGREIKKGNPEKKIQMRYTKITTLPLNRVIILCRDVVNQQITDCGVTFH